MIGKTNVGGGGGNAFAYIGAVYPVGSTCTCTNGVRTLTAKGTGGLYVFNIPYADDWTVTATNGTYTKSETVTITNQWQDVVVEISYWDGTLYDTGDQYTAYTGGWQKNASVKYYNNNNGTLTFQEARMVMECGANGGLVIQTSNMIDMTGVESITVAYSNVIVTGDIYLVVNTVSSGTIRTNALFTATTSEGEQTYTIRTPINQSAYVYLALESTGGTTKRITKVKLNYGS